MTKGEKTCRYAGYCKYYRSKDYTCNDNNEAATYCGSYDIFENFEARLTAVPADKNKAVQQKS